MRIQHLGVALLVSVSMAACSSQNVKTASNNSAQTSITFDEVGTEAIADKQQRSWQVSRQPQREQYRPRPQQARQHSTATPAPKALRASRGDKTHRGTGRLTRLPDNVASNLRLRGLPEHKFGAYVRPAGGGQPILTAHADTPRNPASTMKLVTTYAGLGVLGPNYRWPTELYTSGRVQGGTLQGDIILKGYGDPEFRERDLRELLQALRAQGIRNINGNLVIDKTYFNVPYQRPIDKNVKAAYNAQPEALLYNQRGSCYEFRNQAGKIQKICPIKPRNQNDLNANLFGAFWKIWVGEMRGHLSGKLSIQGKPANARLVKTHYSRPLRDVIMTINKKSNNVMARQVLLSLGAKQFGAPGTTQKGAAAVGQWLESRGLHFSNLRIENGSGLSRVERISARELGEMLVDAYNSPYRNDFMRSLAILGVDGTLRKRLKTLAGRGKFKTGTLRDVRALAGYLTAANGQTYVVSMLHNDPKARTKARGAHDNLVEWVYYGSRSNFASAE